MSDENSILQSLSAGDHRLLPYLSYLLQDLFELGCNPGLTLTLLERNFNKLPAQINVLELCCGKGATLIQLARKLNIKAVGIDLFEPFIKDAIAIRDQLGLNETIVFRIMDLVDAVSEYRDFDLVIYGGDSDALGNEIESLKKVAQCCSKDGMILYETVTVSVSILEYIFSGCNLEVIDRIVHDPHQIKQTNDANTEKIKLRANELSERYPDRKEIFDSYIDAQEKECQLIENEMIGITYLLKAKS